MGWTWVPDKPKPAVPWVLRYPDGTVLTLKSAAGLGLVVAPDEVNAALAKMGEEATVDGRAQTWMIVQAENHPWLGADQDVWTVELVGTGRARPTLA